MNENFTQSASPAPDLLTRGWGIWAALSWIFAAAAAVVGSQFAALAAFYLWWSTIHPDEPFDLTAPETLGPAVAVTTCVSAPIVIGLVALAARLQGAHFSAYVALAWPRWRHVLIGVGVLAIILVAGDLITQSTGRGVVPDTMTDAYRTAGAAGLMPLFALALIVFAPLGEEIVFRGFLYRGLSPRLGPLLTVVLTAAVWSVIHVQYEWFVIWQIFVLGLALGWMRWFSGTTMLPIVLHALTNAVALAQTAALASN